MNEQLGWIVVSNGFFATIFSNGLRGFEVVEDPLPVTARIFSVDISKREESEETIVYLTGCEPRQYRPRWRPRN